MIWSFCQKIFVIVDQMSEGKTVFGSYGTVTDRWTETRQLTAFDYELRTMFYAPANVWLHSFCPKILLPADI
jgi:hypothetical protein